VGIALSPNKSCSIRVFIMLFPEIYGHLKWTLIKTLEPREAYLVTSNYMAHFGAFSDNKR